MKRSLVISDWFYSLSHTIKRNRVVTVVYALICLLFLVVGIAVGITVSDKIEYVTRNGAVIFKYLRGDIGIVTFFFFDFGLTVVYCLFAASMFFNKALAFLSLAPCAYRSYVLGMNTSIIIVVYSVSAIPMLFVLFVPMCIIEITLLCMLSFRCFKFNAMNGSCMPSKTDVIVYYKGTLQYIFVLAVCMLAKSITVVLFGSALIGIVGGVA